MKDILTLRQLLDQKERRERVLNELQKGGAPPDAVDEAKKKLRMTQLRIMRMERTNNQH